MKLRQHEIPELTDDDLVTCRSVFDGESNTQIELPTDGDLWNGINEIRAEIYMPEGTSGSIECTITLETRHEGVDYPDGFWLNALVSPRAGNIWEGWRDFRFPAEAFYTKGIPAGWQEIESAVLSAPEGCRIRNVRFVEREIHAGPRMTDAALIEAIDPSRQGLEALQTAVTETEALAVISAYFRRYGSTTSPTSNR